MPGPDADLHYRPHTDGFDWATRLGADACLVVGRPTDDVADALSHAFVDCRVVPTSPFAQFVHRGLYAILEDTTWACLYVVGGSDEEAARSIASRYTEDSHLLLAQALWRQHWQSAVPLAGEAQYLPGDIVRVIGRGIGRVKSSRRVD